MKQTFSTLALCATLGLAVAGCQGNQGSSAASATVTASAVAAGATTSPASSGASRPGVIANCTNPLSKEPASIMLGCAKADIGVQDLTWTSWTDSSAVGKGQLWENTCVPDCAAANLAHYPVKVTLSTVKASAKGQWFSRLTVTWEGNRPRNGTPDMFTLVAPTFRELELVQQSHDPIEPRVVRPIASRILLSLSSCVVGSHSSR